MKLRPTALRPYLFKNIIRKPKPIKIMTCTSWNTAKEKGEGEGEEGETLTNWNVMERCMKM